MSSQSVSSIHHKILNQTSLFGIKLWIIIVICIAFLVLVSFSITACLIFGRRWRRRRRGLRTKSFSSKTNSTSMNKRLLSRSGWDIEMSILTPEKELMYPDQCSTGASGTILSKDSTASDAIGRSCIQYTLEEIEAATNRFADENLIGSGDHGIVYLGILWDGTPVAVKKLLVMNRSSSLRDFTREVEAMWCVRHKNLVKLLGFCAMGTYRVLVYEYVDNGNLKQWLHNSICKLSPLTWNARMSIIEGIAKGLTYLHEDSEHKILHQHLKSSNILLDKQWNPKISDFGISNFLGPEWSHAIARPLGMSGYIAPEYVNAAILDAKSDVYSFGILIMEIISGKTSVEQSVTEIEEYLVDWIRSMVQTEEFDQIVDPKLPEMPDLLELKRVILIALRCVDPDANNRPKVSDVIHMLEPCDLLLTDESAME